MATTPDPEPLTEVTHPRPPAAERGGRPDHAGGRRVGSEQSAGTPTEPARPAAWGPVGERRPIGGWLGPVGSTMHRPLASFRSSAGGDEPVAEASIEPLPREGQSGRGATPAEAIAARPPWRGDPPPVPVSEVAQRRAVAEGWPTDEDVTVDIPDPKAEVAVADPDETAAIALPAAASIPALPVGRHESIEDDLIETTVELAPHLPRICRTCRDFRPAEGGERGWCTNEWAFTHRRMVAPTEEAPCTTSLGTWWLPADEVWSTAVDVSAHGQPTPILDAVVAFHRALDRSPEEPARQRRRS